MSTALERGETLARILAGAWRRSPPECDLDPDALTEVAPLLLAAGSAPLAWARLRDSRIEPAASAAGLREAYRLAVLKAALGRRQLAEAFTAFRAAGIEPILGKGWAAARLYAEEGMRPYTDLDLAVREDQREAAQELLVSRRVSGQVDLHVGFQGLDHRSWQDLLTRALLLPVEGVALRVLGAEDQLRLSIVHLLGHGAWRPLWLCDVGAAVESVSPGFDWDRVLAGDGRRAGWIACTLVLARDLLGARLDGVPALVAERVPPRWLRPTVLAQWGRRFRPQGARLPMAWQARLRPAGLPRALLERWPNGIEASVGMHAPFNELPRWPFQLAESLRRTTRFLVPQRAAGVAAAGQ